MTNSASSKAIEARIAENRARRERARRISIVAILVAAVLDLTALSLDAPKPIVGLGLLGMAVASIGTRVATNRHDEAYRLYGLRIAALAGLVLTLIAVGVAIASAVTGESETAVDWQLSVVGAVLMVASLWLEPKDGGA